MLLLFPENIACCRKNALQGSLSFKDNDYTNIAKNIEVDYKYYSISSYSVANMMAIKYKPETLNLKKLSLDN